jgi:hypothetical protein
MASSLLDKINASAEKVGSKKTIKEKSSEDSGPGVKIVRQDAEHIRGQAKSGQVKA